MILLLILPPDMADPTFNVIHATVKKMLNPFDVNLKVLRYKRYLWREKNVVEDMWADPKNRKSFLFRDDEGIYMMSNENPRGQWSMWGYGGGDLIMPVVDYAQCCEAKTREREHNWETSQPNNIKDLAAVLLPCNLFPIAAVPSTFKPNAVLPPDDTWYNVQGLETSDFHTGLQSRLSMFTGSQVVTISYSSYVDCDL